MKYSRAERYILAGSAKIAKAMKDPTVHIGLDAYGESKAATTHKYLTSPKKTGEKNLSGSSLNPWGRDFRL